MKCPKCGYEPTSEEYAKAIKMMEQDAARSFSMALQLGFDIDVSKMMLGMQKVMEGLKEMQGTIDAMKVKANGEGKPQ